MGLVRLASNGSMVPAPEVTIERRRMPRFSTAGNGGLVPIDLAGSAGLVLDASPTGLLVHSLDRLPAGSHVNVGLWVVGSDTRLLAGANVVWSDEDGRAGLSLVDTPPQWAARIAELLGGDADAVGAAPAAPGHEAAPHFVSPAASSLLDLAAAPPAPAEATQADFISLVEQALSIAEADGAALALQQQDGIYCVASSGRAPGVGARLNPVSGISGECYRSARPVVCNDAEHDARINPDAARRLNLRSLAVVPVLCDGKSIGLLQVLSQRAAAFSDVHVELLDYIAEQVALRVPPASTAHATADPTLPAVLTKVPDHRPVQNLAVAEDTCALPQVAPLAAIEVDRHLAGPSGNRRSHDWVTAADSPHTASPVADPAPVPSFAMVSSDGPSLARWVLLALLFLALAAAAVWYLAVPDNSPAAAPPPPASVEHPVSHSPTAARVRRPR